MNSNHINIHGNCSNFGYLDNFGLTDVEDFWSKMCKICYFVYFVKFYKDRCDCFKGANYWDFANALAIPTNAPHGKESIHPQNTTTYTNSTHFGPQLQPSMRRNDVFRVKVGNQILEPKISDPHMKMKLLSLFKTQLELSYTQWVVFLF